ncbi:uroporphyrinogen decarboxylase family protein [Sporomusa acidovorans]|uniref:Uroporphyrinogen decarboxylase n=1 Tax=Sporomusa acidovorans (strain ATCC 49682 / DSM 3132 / Mol) TaxID=1123286 RepID=A0ABZ3IVU2_SPOA4|nr:uroporphyrinogen decarboxylase family protein [Sporomusa acidovorans]OZC24039.1 uroporphyrinogen decarboxylase [Sporomusa acidovorans DSM 3132]SDF58244.1 uroporphyrinogen decarboxylase [Sporomusa acidovorans]
MNGKERVLKTLQFEPVDRTPWVPYAGVQTANLIGVDAETYLKSADNIVKGIMKAYEMYQPDGLPIVFDVQMEAEALGCVLKWAKDNPPAVDVHVLEHKELSELKLPTERDGRYPIALEAARRLVAELGDKVALYALICGPFTLALHLKGTALFSDMIKRHEKVDELLAFCLQVCKDLSGMYAATGVDIIAVVDPMTSQIAPKQFERFVKPVTTELNRYVKSLGLKVTSFCCGNATKNIELMCQTETNGIAFDENVSLAYAKDIATKYKVSYGGNLPLTTVMMFGSPLENVEEARKEIEIGQGVGYILSPGCDIPFDTPINNLVAISNFINGKASSLELLESEQQFHDEDEPVFDDVEIKPGQVFIEIVTLDSEGCPPCQYMCESVKKVLPRYEGRLTWRESLVKTRAGIKRMATLGVKNLPAMLINNEVVFDNIIPSDSELIAAIEKRIG